MSKKIYIKNNLNKLLGVFFMFLLFGSYVSISAIGSPYQVGETLDPNCDPGELNCIVDIGGITMVYPSAGIPASTGSAWGTSITDNSTNWNTAYGWGNWASNFGSTSGTIAEGNDSRIINGQNAYGWGNHASAGYLTSLTGALLATGTTIGATSQAQEFTNGIISPTILGGTSTTQGLNFQTTSGVGSTGADMHFLVGNNGATEALTILNDGNIGIGINAPLYKLDVFETGTGIPLRVRNSSTGGGGLTIGTTYTGGGGDVRMGYFLFQRGTVNMSGVSSYTGTTTSDSDLRFETSLSGTRSEKMRLNQNGNLGIGTTSPTYKLDVKGTTASSAIRSDIGLDIYPVPNPTTPTGAVSAGGSVDTGDHIYRVTYITALGETNSIGSAVIATTPGNNTVTLTIPVSTDSRVTGRKIYRTKANEEAYDDYYLATVADNSTTSYIDTIADTSLTGNAGVSYFRTNTTSNYITLSGSRAAVVDNNATYLGRNAGSAITTGGKNVFVGSGAGQYTTTATDSTVIGHAAGYGAFTGSGSTFVGAYAGYNTTASGNTALGGYALFSGTLSAGNTTVGFGSLYGLIDGSYNTAFGSSAGRYIADGSTANTTSDYSLYLGRETKASADNNQNEIVIGYNTIGNGSNTTTIGNASTLRTYLRGVNIAAGTATAGTAPLKLTTGTALTTPEDGAMEYHGSHLYFTIGSTRYQLDQQPLLSDVNFNTKGGTDAGASITAGAQDNTLFGYQAGGDLDVTLGNTAVGYMAMPVLSGVDNNYNGAFGYKSLYSLTDGTQNVGLGDHDLTNLQTGDNNTALGSYALWGGTSYSDNTAVGNYAFYNSANVAIGNQNTAVGRGSAMSATGTGGTYVGYISGQKDNGTGNVFIGSQAGSSIAGTGTAISTNYSTGVGFKALYSLSSGSNNNAFGFSALNSITTGGTNLALGSEALWTIQSGGSNVAVGHRSLYSATASYNTGVGAFSLNQITSGTNNTALGYDAGRFITGGATANTTSTNSLYLGYGAKAGADGNTNETVIGYNATGRGSNTAQWGNTSTTNHYLSGNIQFSSYGAGSLVTDASGNITASSDENLKNIQGYFNNKDAALETIKSINPIIYTWKNETGFDTENTYAGFSAQNIQAVIPEAVGIDPKGYLTLSDRPILATTVNAIKELDLKIEEIKINLLEQNNSIFDLINMSFENELNWFNKIFIKTVVTEGIEMKDTETGEFYCVTIKNGEFEKIQGECSEENIEDEIIDTTEESPEEEIFTSPNEETEIPQTEEQQGGDEQSQQEEDIEQLEPVEVVESLDEDAPNNEIEIQ